MRRVLRVPAENLRFGLEKSVKDLDSRRDETTKIRGESERAARYFGGLVRDSEQERNRVADVDLDAPAPGP